jgi:radical SAM-linked protein
MRAFQRALRRSGLPVWHTEGFHPHIYVSLPLPLPLGAGSIAEILDFALTEDTLFEEASALLNAVLPEGLRILRPVASECDIREIKAAEYAFRFHTRDGEAALRAFNALNALESVEVLKGSKKKGGSVFDVKPHLRIIDALAEDGFLNVRLTIPAGPRLSVNAFAFANAFEAFYGSRFEKISILRTKFLCSNGCEFV